MAINSHIKIYDLGLYMYIIIGIGYSEDRFRSYDPKVMGLVRFLCATSLFLFFMGFMFF